MQFLVNPECYHKMCESCVDRIFSLGPSLCPYVGCGKTLRKNRFKKQVFEDLNVEKEVDIRQRVAKVYNKKEEDFPSSKEYNEYLEEVEDMIFKLVNRIDVEEIEAKLEAYKQANRALILENAQKDSRENDYLRQVEILNQEKKRQSQLIAQMLEREEREMKNLAQKEIIRQLATSGGDAKTITREVNHSILRKTSARRKQLEAEASNINSITLADKQPEPTKEQTAATPFTPFAGDRQTVLPFSPRQEYHDPFLGGLDKDPTYQAAGFSVQKAYHRALVQAFFGLGCIISKEKAAV